MRWYAFRGRGATRHPASGRTARAPRTRAPSARVPPRARRPGLGGGAAGALAVLAIFPLAEEVSFAGEAASRADAIGLLARLFLGTEAPGCLDAADADDAGKTDLAAPPLRPNVREPP